MRRLLKTSLLLLRKLVGTSNCMGKKKEVVKEKVVKENHPIIKKRIEKSLDLSIKEGSYASVSTALGPSYFAPFALAVGATTSHIGILNAFANLLPGISQFMSLKNFKEDGKKKDIIYRLILAFVLLFGLIACGLLFLKNVPYVIWGVIGIVGLFYFIVGPIQNSWFVWMGSLVPAERRGRYFSNRTKIIQSFGLIAMIISAVLLDFAKKYGSNIGQATAYTIFGFSLLFALSFVIRMRGIYLLRKQYEPRIKIKKKERITLKKFLKDEPKTPFGHFVLFNSFFKMSMAIASPLFAVYMLKELNFSYTWFIMITIGNTLFNVLFLPSIGKLSDKYGNIILTRISCLMISFIPLVWFSSIFFTNHGLLFKLYLLIGTSLLYGFGGAGILLAERTYAYDTNGYANRKYALPYMSLFIGIGIFIGSLIGAGIAIFDIPIVGTLPFIFLISFVLRLAVTLIGGKNLKEVKDVALFKPRYFIKEFHPLHNVSGSLRVLNHHNYKVVHHI